MPANSSWLRPIRRLPRAAAYLLRRLPLPLAGAAAVAITAGAGGPLVFAAVGLPLLAAYLLLSLAYSGRARQAVATLGQPVVPDPHREPDQQGVVAMLRVRAREQATGRELLHALAELLLAPLDVFVLVLWDLGALVLIAAPILVASDAGPVALGPTTINSTAGSWAAAAAGLALLASGVYATVALADGHAALTRRLLGPRGDELRTQLIELTRSRLRLIDAFDIERRRIERDLHDGAQQQLLSLAMTLDLARIELEGTEHYEAARLVEQAHSQATRTLTELRDLVRAIHPPILVERGLPAAISALAERATLPITTSIAIPTRPPESVETAAYFLVSEALANAAKHSHATGVEVDLQLRDGTLQVRVRDDGVGGADPEAGSGLTGIADRISALGGRLTLSSPPGGPTTIHAQIPASPEKGPT